MERVSYKPLLERFSIPRPTLIEWQKCAESNWRSRHIEYLREQLGAESATREELRAKGLDTQELFLVCVFLFLTCTNGVINKPEFKRQFKNFLINQPKSIEHQHDFAKRIWKESPDERAAECAKVTLMIDSLSAFQYYILVRMALGFNAKLFTSDHLSPTHGLDGKTWQEMHMYDREFSLKSIGEYFESIL
jgi:hypothetical protein